jgi:hypothetical protein
MTFVIYLLVTALIVSVIVFIFSLCVVASWADSVLEEDERWKQY